MALFDQISEEIKKAMLAKDHSRLEALRGIKKVFLEAKTAPGHGDNLDDDEALKIIQKLLKQAEDSAKIYRENNRPDLAEEDEAQAEVFRSFLPKPLSREELRSKVKEIITRLGVTDIKGMGRVMGEAQKELAGRADGKTLSSVVKSLLS